MNPPQFDAWIKHHTALFPSMISWLEKLTEEQRAATLKAWARILSRVSFGSACEASDRMMLADTIPRYERHPASVATIAARRDGEAAKARETARFGAETVACRQCGDTGTVHVYLVGHALTRWIEHARRFGRWLSTQRGSRGATAIGAGPTRQHLPQYEPDKLTIAVRTPGVHQRDNPELREQRADEVEQAEQRAEAT